MAIIKATMVKMVFNPVECEDCGRSMFLFSEAYEDSLEEYQQFGTAYPFCRECLGYDPYED